MLQNCNNKNNNNDNTMFRWVKEHVNPYLVIPVWSIDRLIDGFIVVIVRFEQCNKIYHL